MGRVQRSIYLFLSVLYILSISVTGCSDGQSTAVASETKNEGVGKQTLKPVKLNWYVFGSGREEEQQMIEEEANKYLKSKINAEIKIYPLEWNELLIKTNAMSAANEPYDICFTADWLELRVGVSKNRFLDITNLIDEYAPKTKSLLGPELLKGGQINGRQYAIPTSKEMAHAHGFMFNKELVDKYNMDIDSVKTARDIEPLLKIIKEKEKNIIPFELNSGGNFASFLELDPIAGYTVIPIVTRPEDTQVLPRYDIPEVLEMQKLAREFYLKGYMASDTGAINSTVEAKRQEGGVFAYITMLRPGKDRELSNNKVTWVQKYMNKIYTSNYDLAGSMNAISSTSNNPERALMFLELMNTDKYLNNLIAFGIESRHYIKVSDRVIEQVPDSGYFHTSQWVYGNQFLNYLRINEDPQKWSKYEEFNKKAIPMRGLGFSFNVEPWKNEFDAMKMVVSEFHLDEGIQDPESVLPEYKARLKAAGIDRVLRACQQEYDEWLAKQK